MHTRPGTRLCVLLLLVLSHAGGATEVVGGGCEYAVGDIAPRIKAVLGPRFAAADDGTALTESFRELELLLLDTGHCRAVVQSAERNDANRQAHIREWHTLNQWLYRLTNFVGQNSRGDLSVSWRDEYALFAEVYEFEP
ncbi:MAG: hypothetical protein CMN57_09430 [Gammaproteobacteria bacterium]|nr:hypothetical protein [Gammaproteobacteria bacterium]